jgi:hypothetical protein
VHHIWELHAISNEKDGDVVAHHIKVTFPGVEFHCKSTWITESFRGSAFVNYSGETDDDWGLNTRAAEKISAGEVGDVVGDFKETLSGSATGVNYTFRDTLAVELQEDVQVKGRRIRK